MAAKAKWTYVAPAGTLSAAFHPSGSLFVVASSEGNSLYVFESSDLSEPKEVSNHEAGILDIAFSTTGTWAASSGADHRVNTYNGQSFAFDQLIARFESSANTVAFAPSEDLIAAADSEGLIKLFNRLDPSQVRTLKGHKGQVKSVAFDPKRDLFASTGSDGLLKVWEISEGKDVEVASLDILPHSEAKSGQLARLAFSPNGDKLAVTTSSGVAILDRPSDGRSWKVSQTLSQNKQEAVALAWSSNGAYIASSHITGSGSVVWLWKIKGAEAVTRTEYKSVVTSVAWNPVNQSLLMVAKDGHIAFWEDIVDPKLLTSGARTEVAKYTESKENLSKLIDVEADEVKEEEGSADSDDSDSDDSDELEGFIEDEEAERKKKVKEKRRSSLSTAPLDVLSDPLYPSTVKKAKKRPLEDDMITDLNSFSFQSTSSYVEFQKPFQVNSSDDDISSRRYLVWNDIGSITCRYEDNSKGVTSHIKVDFADQSAHKAISMSRDYNVSLGALGNEAVLLATTGSKEGKEKATVFYHQFANLWAANSDWTIQLPLGEVLHCVAIGDLFVALATSRYLRIYSYAGAQRQIISLKGPIVTLAAKGDLLAVVYHAAAPTRYGSRFTLFNIGLAKQVVLDDILPLTLEQDACLEWIGFTDSKMLVSLDSYRVLRVLLNPESNGGDWSNQWAPLLDGMEALKGVYFWPIRISSDQMIYVPCQEDNAPSILPPPVPDTVPLRMPIVGSGKNTDLEENHMRLQIFFNDLKHRRRMEAEADDPEDLSWTVDHELVSAQTDLDKLALQIFRATMQNDRAQRALDWASNFTLMKSMNIAAQWATLSNFSQLSERINTLKGFVFSGESSSVAPRPLKRRRIEPQAIPSSDIGDDDDDVIHVAQEDDAMDVDEPAPKSKYSANDAKETRKAPLSSGKKANPFAKSTAPITSPTKNSDIFSAINRASAHKNEGKKEKPTPEPAKKKTVQRGLFG